MISRHIYNFKSADSKWNIDISQCLGSVTPTPYLKSPRQETFLIRVASFVQVNVPVADFYQYGEGASKVKSGGYAGNTVS